MNATSLAKPEKSYLSAAVESISPWATSRSSSPKPTTSSANAPGPGSQEGTDHTVSHRYGLSSRIYPKDCPPLNARWFYAVDVPKRKPRLLKESSQELRPLPPPKKFVAFSQHDSRSIEDAFQKLVEEDEDQEPGRYTRNCDSDVSQNAGNSLQNTRINESGNVEQIGGRIKVPVNEDFLFDVDIEKRELAPVYWLGPIYAVRRGSWFYQEGSILRPCEENLATQLEEGYLKVKPFRYPKKLDSPPSESVSKDPGEDLGSTPLSDGIRSDTNPALPTEDPNASETNALEDATAGSKEGAIPPPHEPQTHRLFGTYMKSIVTYQDDTVAWISSDGIMSRVSSTVYQRFAGGGYLGGVKIVRGFTDPGKTTKVTEGKLERPPTPNTAVISNANNPGLQLDERQQKLLKRRSAPPSTGLPNDVSNSMENKQPVSETREAALKRQISSMVLESIDAEQGEEAVRRRDEKEIQTDYIDHDGDDQSRGIEHLILVTHGIGQRLGMRTESVNFVHDVNILRQTLKSVYSSSADLQALNSEIDKLPKNCRVQVLPVCWRHLLDFPRQGLKQSRKEHDIGDTSGDDEEYPSLEDITVEGVPFVRSLITDLALDILLYQSAYREHISGIVLRECNRIHKLFLERNPYFKGNVSLIGHSLGSAILFDLLCRQKEEAKVHDSFQHTWNHTNRPSPRTTKEKDEKDLSFNFSVTDFYCLGSPIGLFQMLKGRTIAARHQPGAVPAESPLDPDHMDDPFLASYNPASGYSAGETISSITGLPYTISSPKCAQLFNIFHPSDPISYRLEPLIAPAMSLLKPQVLPYTKKGIFGGSSTQGLTGIGARVGQSVSGFWSNFSSGIASSLLNRSLGLSGDDVANMNASQSSAVREPQISMVAGTNISASGVTSEVPAIVREDSNEKKRQLAEDTAAADRDGTGANAPTLIDSEIETLFSGFEKTRRTHPTDESQTRTDKLEAEEKGKKLRKEELKVRGLNQNGRVDFSIQE